jgi:hypothetical protein
MKTIEEIIQAQQIKVLDYDWDGGAFEVFHSGSLIPLRVIASWTGDWDHVSVSRPDRLPSYAEMKYVKRLFFKEDEWAYEFHPPVDKYISINPNVLHLWRLNNAPFPTPPEWMV